MHLRLLDAHAAWRAGQNSVCPACGSDQFRPSRRTYSGLWSELFGVRLVKCVKCGQRFPSTSRVYNWSDLRDLPFKPVEIEEPQPGVINPQSDPEIPKLLGAEVCPVCRSNAVRPVNAPMSVARLFQLSVSYRCARCNAGYSRISGLRILTRGILFAIVLGALVFAATSRLRSGTSERSPHLRRDMVPTPEPPVFR
jgi:DNA-directed RNA polymerase subunit RPC12/RpoP